MVKNRVKTVNIGEGHRKHQDITWSLARFQALICHWGEVVIFPMSKLSDIC